MFMIFDVIYMYEFRVFVNKSCNDGFCNYSILDGEIINM